MQIKVWRDPYCRGANLMTKKEIELEPGLTVLVGCNGAGKSTLLRNIEHHCKDNSIPCHMFDNLSDGGTTNSLGAYLAGMGSSDDLSVGITVVNSSEGERIKVNLRQQAKFYNEFISTGLYKDRHFSFSAIFSDSVSETVSSSTRVLLYDAVDSGMSIDAVQDIRQFFTDIIAAAQESGVELYIIISANEFELCDGTRCLDVQTGNYLKFQTYSEFKKFILASRKKKEARLDREIKWEDKQREKEVAQFERKKQKCIERIEKLVASSSTSVHPSARCILDSNVRNELYKLDEFSRNCKVANFSAEIRDLREKYL